MKNDSWESNERMLKLIKYYVFFKKYKKIYIPTSLEIEKLIVKLFLQKYKYKRDKRIQEYTRAKVFQEKDEHFSDVSDDPDYLDQDGIYLIIKVLMLFLDQKQKRTL